MSLFDNAYKQGNMPPWYTPIPKVEPFQPEPIPTVEPYKPAPIGPPNASIDDAFRSGSNRSASDEQLDRLYEAAKIWNAVNTLHRMYANKSPQYTHSSEGPNAFQTSVYDNGIHPGYR